MKKIMTLSIISILLFSVMVFAISDKQKQERVLSDDTTKESITFFEGQGCTVKHVLRNKIAYSCPEDIAETYGLMEDEIYELKDSVSVSQINADKVWLEGYEGEGVIIAILDTGIDGNHPEFQQGDIVGEWDFVGEDGTAEDTVGHGTHVAGIITANGINENAKGAAPGAKIIVGKVCNESGCYNSDIQAGIEWAVIQGADVISMSLGSNTLYRNDCDYTSLAIASNWAVSWGVVVVVASGNDYSSRGISSPACASGVIAVGAVDDNDNVAAFSNSGSSLDVVAPGVNVYSTMPTYEVYYNSYGYTQSYSDMSGTSMATPYTAATVALILEAHTDYSVDEVKEALYNTAVNVDKRRDGKGRIDTLAAVNYIIGGGEEPEDPTEPNCPPGLFKKYGYCP